jgi:hypothetical protein
MSRIPHKSEYTTLLVRQYTTGKIISRFWITEAGIDRGVDTSFYVHSLEIFT